MKPIKILLVTGLSLFVSGLTVQAAPAKCTYKEYNTFLGLMLTVPGKPGQAVLNGGVDADWFKCAQPTGKLHMDFFGGATKSIVEKSKAPIFSLKDLDKDRRFQQEFPIALLCASKPKFIGFEFRGTGEFAKLNHEGRSIKEITCP